MGSDAGGPGEGSVGWDERINSPPGSNSSYNGYMPVIAYPHIEIAADGTIYIGRTRFKILMLLMERLAYHWDADELHHQHPQLSLAQIHGALTYYYDHQEELDRQLAERIRQDDQLFAQGGDGPYQRKLRAT